MERGRFDFDFILVVYYFCKARIEGGVWKWMEEEGHLQNQKFFN